MAAVGASPPSAFRATVVLSIRTTLRAHLTISASPTDPRKKLFCRVIGKSEDITGECPRLLSVKVVLRHIPVLGKAESHSGPSGWKEADCRPPGARRLTKPLGLVAFRQALALRWVCRRLNLQPTKAQNISARRLWAFVLLLPGFNKAFVSCHVMLVLLPA